MTEKNQTNRRYFSPPTKGNAVCKNVTTNWPLQIMQMVVRGCRVKNNQSHLHWKKKKTSTYASNNRETVRSLNLP